MLSYILRLDTALFLFINNNFHFSFLNDNMRAVTFLGNGWVAYWLVLVYVYIYNRSKFKQSFFLLFLTQLVPGIIDITVKRFVNRPRPIVALHELIKHGIVHVNLLGRHLTEHSFPSGHATTAFSLAVALAYLFPKHYKLFYALAFIVAFSRVYDGEHYPLDVIAGGILGYSFAKITLILYKKIRKINGYNFEKL
ncbi:MAG: phosphatase PAP2 family protein [Deltaproteobacteria bacterium]|nr:phosphatase PAP2 family protein [Deltaproteobacteria bacterium]MCL5879885.1 phosphatase PAP2 family protein [Deltaproteobacteria bacterium]MDA8303839.1 phosphatase PAP2 family protein [Deltaproteobacteria bacterium]